MIERRTTMGGITAVLAYAATQGLDVKELCDRVGLDSAQFGDPLQLVPFTLTRRVWCAVIERLPNQNVGVGLGTMVRHEQFGYAGLLLNQVRNGLELVQLTIDGAPLTDTALVDDPVTLRHAGDQIEIRAPSILSAGIPERTEVAFLSLLSNLRRLGLPELRPTSVRVRHAHDAKRALVEPHFGCKVIWSAGEDAIWFSRESLSAPLPGSHPRAAADLRALIAERTDLSFRERVRQVVSQQVQRGSVSQHQAASTLGLSARSLQRKLSKDGLSYGELVDQALEGRAQELMRCERHTLEDIAIKLGYSDLSSFSRFWKRLTGQTPASYRSAVLKAQATSESF